MTKLSIGNSYSKILGFTAKQEKQLKDTFSYTVGGSAAYFSGFGIRKKYLLNKRGEFPTGLLHRLPFKPDIVVENRFKPASQPSGLILKGEPYPWQQDAVKTAIKASRGIISAPTGTGKSMAMMLLVARLNVRTLIVVPTVEIAKQLHASVEEQGLSALIDVHNVDSAALRSQSENPYDCLIIDEAHHSAAKTYRKLNKTMWAGIYYRFFFTATPFRNDNEETILFESIAGEVIYRLDYKTAIKKGYIVPVEAYYFDLPKQKTEAFTYQEVYKELIVANTSRNTLVRKLIQNLTAAKKYHLCLVKEIAHGYNISSSLVSGQDEASRELIQEFNVGEIHSLVATTGIMGEGVDSRPCEYVIVAGLGKAKSQFMQQIGRAVRKYPGKESAKVIIFRDRSHKYLLRHFNEQCKVLKEEYGIKPIKLEIS